MTDDVKKFTVKQQRFVDFYDGNATDAALKAGYSEKTAAFIGAENLKKPKIAKAIAERESKKKSLLLRIVRKGNYFGQRYCAVNSKLQSILQLVGVKIERLLRLKLNRICETD